MTPEQLDLALRLVLATPELVRRQPSGQIVDSHGMGWVYSDEAEWLDGGSGFQVPELVHAGTVGCLLTLLGADLCSIQQYADGFALRLWGRDDIHIGATLGEAAARALLAIHEVRP